MANNMVKFYRGLVGSLPTVGELGSLYITTDEGAIYYGTGEGMKRLGDFIQVDSVSNLPSDGANTSALYYCVGENILCRFDKTTGEWVQINKQKTLAQLGGVSQEAYNAKIAALEKADTDNATATSTLSTYVGTIPNGEDGNPVAASVIAYINKKTDGIATSGNLEALGARVTTAEGEIDDLQAAIGEGGSVTTAIANAKAAGDNAQADVDALELKVGTVEEGKTVVGMIEAVDALADQGIADAATAQARADEAYNLANGKATMDQVNTAIAGAGHAVKADVDAALEQLGKDYVAADTALETKLQGNIDKKVDQTAYDTKMTELGNEDTRLAGLISDMDTAYKAADTILDGRIATLEGTITGLSGAMHFKGVKNEIPEDVSEYADGDVIIVGDKEYVFNGGAFVEFGDVSAEGDRIAALEGIVGKAAEGENAATGLVKSVADNTAAIAAEKVRAEAKEAELVQADVDNLAEAKKYTDDEIAELNIGDYIKKADADAAYATASHDHDDKYDAKGDAEQALADAKTYADGLAGNYDAAGSAAAAQSAAEAKAAQLDATLKTELQGEIDSDVEAAINAEVERANGAYDTKGAAATAQANAEATAASALATARTEISAEIDADVKALADGAVATNTANIASLTELLTWGSF